MSELDLSASPISGIDYDRWASEMYVCIYTCILAKGNIKSRFGTQRQIFSTDMYILMIFYLSGYGLTPVGDFQSAIAHKGMSQEKSSQVKTTTSVGGADRETYRARFISSFRKKGGRLIIDI